MGTIPNRILEGIRKILKSAHMGLVSLPVPVKIGAASVLVGLFGGIGVWLFKLLIRLVQSILLDQFVGWLKPLGPWTVALAPILGGLIVGGMTYWIIGQERYHGLTGVIETCALAGGRLPYWKMPARVIAAAISIGAGASVGPEDPSVQLGANIGSMFSDGLHLSEEQGRALVAGGAAAGIAAAFNAPIAGVFFAMEVLLGELSSSAFAFAAIASVASAAFTQAVAGSAPAFNVPAYSFRSAWTLLLYLALGLLAGPIAAGYSWLIYRTRRLFGELPIPTWVRPVIAGTLVGLVVINLPSVYGVGYDVIGLVLANNTLPLITVFLLLIAKLILTPISTGGGFYGGVFAPALFIGAMLGYLFGSLADILFPGAGLDRSAFAMVGMAAVLAGSVHAPLTAILLLFEMTRDYRIILPLMFAVAVSLTISRMLEKESVYRRPLAEQGIHLEQGRDVDVLANLQVGEIMEREKPVLEETLSVAAAIDRLSENHETGLPVVDAIGRLVGMFTLQDMEKAAKTHPKDNALAKLTVGAVCTRTLVTTYPDEPANMALRRMSARDIGRLPVVQRQDSTQLVGMVGRSDIIRAYDLALARRAAGEHISQQTRLGLLGGVKVHELRVEDGSPCCGLRIADAKWPQTSVISAIRRGRQVLLPHGDTTIQPGDILVVVTENEDLEDAYRLCQPPWRSTQL